MLQSPKQLAKQLLQKNYYLARAHYYYTLARMERQFKKPSVLVLQMGKVGSKSVVQSLKMADIDRNVYHLHFLRPELVDKFERERKEIFPDIERAGLKHLWRCRYVYRRIKKGFNGEKLKLITLVRDPIARNVSDFFHHLAIKPSDSGRKWKLRSERYHNFELVVSNNELDKLADIFFETYPHDNALKYFDHHLKPIFGIDLYAESFQKSRGYKIYEGGQVDILLIKLEHLSRCVKKAFSEFLNIDNLTLVKNNVGDQKEYADLYKLFKASVQFPPAFIDCMYSSKFAQHFYSDAELETFRMKWSKISSQPWPNNDSSAGFKP